MFMMANNVKYKKKKLHRLLTIHFSVVHLYAQSVPKTSHVAKIRLNIPLPWEVIYFIKALKLRQKKHI